MTRRAVLAAALACAGCATVADRPDQVQVQPFGRTADGQAVTAFSFANAAGMRVGAIGYGATLTAIEVPDRTGRIANVVLSLPDIAAYQRSKRRWASVIGRYAGRIDGARFTLDGVTHRLEPGRNGVTLHGGTDGYDRRVWTGTPFRAAGSSGVVFRLDSPAGDQGFPGRLRVEVTYRLLDRRNELHIEYHATTDAPTVFNPTNHGYINLGAAAGSVGGHRVTIAADRHVETDARKIPTGRMPSVAGTPLDLRQPTLMAPALVSRDPLLAPSAGFDHSLVLRGDGDALRLAAVVEEPVSGRRLEILTTEPSVQFNTGSGFDGTEAGSEGVAYQRHAGLAIETQHLPDSPNQPSFPSTVVRPGTEFRSLTIYRFSTVPAG